MKKRIVMVPVVSLLVLSAIFFSPVRASSCSASPAFAARGSLPYPTLSIKSRPVVSAAILQATLAYPTASLCSWENSARELALLTKRQ